MATKKLGSNLSAAKNPLLSFNIASKLNNDLSHSIKVNCFILDDKFQLVGYIILVFFRFRTRNKQ